MALIGMAVYSTEENKKDECLEKTLESLRRTVDFNKSRLMLSVNASTQKTKEILLENRDIISFISWNNKNLGTAEAINLLWFNRRPGEHCIKMDDDVVIANSGVHCDWVELMEEAIRAYPQIGIIGMKRKDCIETTVNADPNFKSELIQLPHISGHRWIVIEKAQHIMGTCTMYNSALLDKIGYLYQPAQYGYDDTLACHRSEFAGFINCFLPHIEIDHIDEGKTPYQDWKHKHSGEQTETMIGTYKEYLNGSKSIYYNPFTNA